MAVPDDRKLECMKRPDGKIAIFHKTNGKLRAFVVTKDDVEKAVFACMNKKIIGDPLLSPNALAAFGGFSIEGSTATIEKLMKIWEPTEIH